MGATSGAAAFVSGLAALLFSVHPRLTNREIRDLIEQSAEKVGGMFMTYTHLMITGRGTRKWVMEGSAFQLRSD
jgi:subtilisin family serine protease